MKRFLKGLGIVVVTVSVGILPALAASPVRDLVSQATGQAPQTRPGSAITIRVFQFQPGQIDVKGGTAVTWTNQDDIEHTVTSGSPERPDGRFNARLAGKGATFASTFSQPGTYPYFCSRHQSMRGEVRVN